MLSIGRHGDLYETLRTRLREQGHHLAMEAAPCIAPRRRLHRFYDRRAAVAVGVPGDALRNLPEGHGAAHSKTEKEDP